MALLRPLPPINNDLIFLKPALDGAIRTIGQAIAEGVRTQTRISGVRLPTLGAGLRSQMRGSSDISCGAGG